MSDRSSSAARSTAGADHARLSVAVLMSADERAVHGPAIEAGLAAEQPAYLDDAALFGLSVADLAPDAPGLLIFGPSAVGRLALARELRRRLANFQLVFLLPAGDGERIRRLLPFVPGLGDAWTIAPDATAEAVAAVLSGARRAALAAARRARLHGALRQLVSATAPAADAGRRGPGAPSPEQILAMLLPNLAQAIVVCTGDGRIVTWNEGACRLFGAPAERAIGLHLTELIGGEPFRGLLRAAARAGNMRAMEVPIIDARRRPRWIEATLVHSTGEGNEILLLVARDVDEQHREQLIGAQRAHVLREIATDAAHDFNNLMTVVLGNTATLEQELAGNANQLNLARQARLAAERGAGLGQRLLASARGDLLRPERIDIARLLAELQRVLVSNLAEGLDLVVAAASGCEVVANRHQLEAALLTLVSNATDAMPQGGTLELTASAAAIDRVFVALGHPCREYVEITVADTGVGMTHKVAARAFEPFFTTKAAAGRTGIGLSIVQGFVSESKGFVTLDSRPDRGTTVRLYLPRAAAGG